MHFKMQTQGFLIFPYSLLIEGGTIRRQDCSECDLVRVRVFSYHQ